MTHIQLTAPLTLLSKTWSKRRPQMMGGIAFGLMLLFTLGLGSSMTQAQTYTEQTLHVFGGSTSDGANPRCSLITVNGTLYGTTVYGGSSANNGHGFGTIFAYNVNTNTETTPYRFGGTDGSLPYAGLLNVSGTLYGTTNSGGANNSGILFSFNPVTQTETRLYSFMGNPDGANPQASLINVGGILYGTTKEGGTDNSNRGGTGPGDGTIFSYNLATNTETPVHIFQNGVFTYVYGGGYPVASLLNVNGVLYGTTEQSGDLNNAGTIYQFSPTQNAFNISHYFSGTAGSDGSFPEGGLVNGNGLLYGTTSAGSTSGSSGTVFSFNPSTNTFKTLYNFTGNGTNGAASTPRGDLVYDPTSGMLYGVTQLGGASNQGTVFSFDPVTNQTQIVFSFSTATGITPTSGLILINNTLYGTTQNGGTNNDGTLFGITISRTAPVAKNDAGRTSYNTTLTIPAPGVLGNDSNGGSLVTAALVTQPSHGTLTFHSDGSFIYVPVTGYLGTDSFTYQDTNSIGKSNIATCTLTVQARTPIAVNDTETFSGTSLVVSAPGVLSNDNTGGSPTTAALVSNPAHGTISFSSDGSFTYVPTAGYQGTDSFTYQDNNSVGKSNIATVTLTVQSKTPIAVNDSNFARYNTTLVIPAPGVLHDDMNRDTSPMTAQLVTGTSDGTVSLNSNGGYTYTPNANFIGTDTFTYQAVNAYGPSNIATVTVIVQKAKSVAHDDSYSMKHDTILHIAAPGILANDDSGDADSLSPILAALPSHGSLILNSDGSFTYTPYAGFDGTDSFKYFDRTSVGDGSPATVTIRVFGDAPTAVNDSGVTQYDVPLSVAAPGVLGNDTDNDSSVMTPTVITNPAHGSVTLNSDGSYVYTPNADYAGPDSFTYKDTNEVGTSNTATVSLTVQAVLPIAYADSYTVTVNTPLVVTAPGVLSNDYAGDSGLFIAIEASQPSNGTVKFNNDGSFTYTPNAGYTGTDGFLYYDENAIGTSQLTTITLTVH